MGIEWVEDVPDPMRHGKWWQILEQLRSRPGHWARVHSSQNTGYAAMLKKGKLGGAKPGEFEAVCRRNVDGSYDLYARFVGVDVESETVAAKGPTKRRGSKRSTKQTASAAND